jgi:general secretion pathway protein G
MRRTMSRRRIWLPAAGFTMLELMVVVAIIVILLGLAAGNYRQSIVRSKEASLKQSLVVMRTAIDQFTLDKQQGPQSLDELVSAGYLRAVPTDPMTNRKDWRVVFGDLLLSPEQTIPGITDVHSSSEKVSPFEGTPYSSW